MRRAILATLPLTLAGALTACDDNDRADSIGPAAPARGVPDLRVKTVVGGLDHPWDVASIGHGRLLVTERDRARLSLVKNGRRHTIDFPSRRVWVSGETGLLGMAVDPDFSQNHRLYICQGGTLASGGHDVHVTAWRLNVADRKVKRIKTLVGGFPTSSGRHGGCRLLVTRSGALLVGTGDAAIGTNPRNLGSFGGKTLRLDRFSGKPWPGNRWGHAHNQAKRYIHTWGHRNVQGLSQRTDGTLWSVEHGPDRDDEVNLLRNGADYGWNPVPGYNESVPMTDRSLPGPQVAARWSSGFPTLATSGADWVPTGRASGWGSYRGALAVAALKASRLLFLWFDHSGHLRWVRVPSALTHAGRLRAVTTAPNGDLLVTTDNGSGRDKVLRISPHA
ncbi:PQQ-dependent sugar dehydrogenase [Nocardioides sp.]|jgi:glucose/arabinose dehydrogenase|uniref:PQQ-dependent sugar dehydrogenase n=1 Tax=Nocardioides sp. TaxID=35761 RepID=UPI002F3F15B4